MLNLFSRAEKLRTLAESPASVIIWQSISTPAARCFSKVSRLSCYYETLIVFRHGLRPLTDADKQRRRQGNTWFTGSTTPQPATPAFATETRFRRYSSGNGLCSTATRPPVAMETRTACDMTAAR
jgi:hypothetical protein